MIPFPNRIAKLIEAVETGQPVAGETLEQMARLQALDVAKAGEDFVRQWAQAEAEHTEFLKGLQ